MTAHRVPLSVLDLALVADGATGVQAIQRAVALAVDLDALGYRRVWYVEHHLAPGVASASPAVLAAAVAARTSRIRVGSGAVLLSTTSPLIAAEQFGTIAALHPGRVDLGLGRAFTVPPSGNPGADAAPARPRGAAGPQLVDGLYVPPAPPNGLNDPALRERILAQQDVIGAHREPAGFREEVELVLDLQRGTYRDPAGGSYTSPPVEGSAFDLWLLASSGGESATVAGALGLPLAVNFHVSPAATTCSTTPSTSAGMSSRWSRRGSRSATELPRVQPRAHPRLRPPEPESRQAPRLQAWSEVTTELWGPLDELHEGPIPQRP